MPLLAGANHPGGIGWVRCGCAVGALRVRCGCPSWPDVGSKVRRQSDGDDNSTNSTNGTNERHSAGRGTGQDRAGRDQGYAARGSCGEAEAQEADPSGASRQLHPGGGGAGAPSLSCDPDWRAAPHGRGWHPRPASIVASTLMGPRRTRHMLPASCTCPVAASLHRRIAASPRRGTGPPRHWPRSIEPPHRLSRSLVLALPRIVPFRLLHGHPTSLPASGSLARPAHATKPQHRSVLLVPIWPGRSCIDRGTNPSPSSSRLGGSSMAAAVEGFPAPPLQPPRWQFLHILRLPISSCRPGREEADENLRLRSFV